MRKKLKAGVGALLVLATMAPHVASAQAGPDYGNHRDGQRSLVVWAAMSRGSSQLGQLGDMPDQTLTIAGVRFAQQLRMMSGTALMYGVEVIPIALMSAPRQSPSACGTGIACTAAVDPRAGVPAHGAGLNPVSLTAIFRTDHALQLLLGATGGALWFDRPVPTTTSAQLNFTGSLDFGVQLISRRGNGFVAMYRFHHLSNAGRGADNPGIASHVLSAGIRWRLAGATR